MVTTAQIRNAQGIALIMVLWIIMLLSVIATGFARNMRTEMELARQLRLTTQARLLAEAGINRGIVALFNSDVRTRWRTDSTPYNIKLGGGQIGITLQDETGLIDLNEAANQPNGEMLQSLFLAAKIPEEMRLHLVDSIIDWHDPDNLRRDHGAEDSDYQGMGLHYGAKDGNFNCVEELLQVAGMTPAIYRRMAPFLTVHSHQPAPDPQVAPPALIAAMQAANAAKLGGAVDPAAGTNPEDPNNPSRTGFGNGQTFTIRATAKLVDTSAIVTATVKRTNLPNQPFAIMTWKEGS